MNGTKPGKNTIYPFLAIVLMYHKEKLIYMIPHKHSSCRSLTLDVEIWTDNAGAKM